MCSTYQINGAYCENIGEFRAAVGEKYFGGVVNADPVAPPIDDECLCCVDYDRMCLVFREIDAPDHVDFAFADKLGGV